MVRVDVSIKLEPKEVREMLTKLSAKDGKTMAEAYDSLVEGMAKLLPQKEAEAYVASSFLSWMKEEGLLPNGSKSNQEKG